MSVVLLSCAQNYDTSEENYEYLVTIKTPQGEMKAICYNETPRHKERFLTLAEEGRFDSTIFHRVINNFMIQGGDLQTKPKKEEEPDRLPAEFVPEYFHRKGALAAARQDDGINPKKRSSGSQFYIVDGDIQTEKMITVNQAKLVKCLQHLFEIGKLGDLRRELDSIYRTGDEKAYTRCMLESADTVQALMGEKIYKEIPAERLEVYTTIGGSPHLDDAYTVFGQVIDGLDVIDKIAAVRTIRNDVPFEPLHISMTVEKVKKKKITKDYGYEFN